MAPSTRTTRHIFVTGGVASSLGKGLTASSLGNLLTARGLRVVMQKLDPYLNVDPGTMNPFQHGEVFVTEDGAETDLDVGHYEPDAVATLTVLSEDEAEVRLDGGDLGLLIGPRGQTLIAVQDLVRLAAQKRGTDRRGKLRIDIGGYRERRREALARFTEQVADEVRSTGMPRALEPMSSMDRKIVHDTVAELGGLETASEGEDPHRHVVIRRRAGS